MTTTQASIGCICLRADAGATVGIGHVMRCLALAQAWQRRGGAVIMVTTTTEPALLERLRLEEIELCPLRRKPGSLDDARELLAAACKHQARWIVLDGYQFDENYHAALKAGDAKLLIIDDLARLDFCSADLVLNQNAHAIPALYEGRNADGKLLAGLGHTLLRKEFLVQNKSHTTEPQKLVVVTMGGSDPRHVTARIIRALCNIHHPSIHIQIVIGAANPQSGALEQLASELGTFHHVETLRNPPDMAAVMSRASLVVTAAGSTCWELACLGTAMLLVVTADNQRPVAGALSDAGAALSVGEPDAGFEARFLASFQHLLQSPSDCQALASAARKLVDGQGSDRVAEAMLCHPVRLRSAVLDDAGLLWRWANDPAVRSASFQQDFIPWEQHLGWLTRRLASPQHHLFIGTDQQGTPLGIARFDTSGDCAEVGFTVAPERRGMGLGWKMVRSAAMKMFDRGVQEIIASAKPDNMASIRALQKAGFEESSRSSPHGHDAVSLTLRKQLES